jgi:hypothetical protein
MGLREKKNEIREICLLFTLLMEIFLAPNPIEKKGFLLLCEKIKMAV